MNGDWPQEAFGHYFWDDARRCDNRIIRDREGGSDSPYTREYTAKILAGLKIGVTNGRLTLPDTVLETKDFLKLIQSLEY